MGSICIESIQPYLEGRGTLIPKLAKVEFKDENQRVMKFVNKESKWTLRQKSGFEPQSKKQEFVSF